MPELYPIQDDFSFQSDHAFTMSYIGRFFFVHQKKNSRSPILVSNPFPHYATFLCTKDI